MADTPLEALIAIADRLQDLGAVITVDGDGHPWLQVDVRGQAAAGTSINVFCPHVDGGLFPSSAIPPQFDTGDLYLIDSYQPELPHEERSQTQAIVTRRMVAANIRELVSQLADEANPSALSPPG
jgi:hypothetical protein